MDENSIVTQCPVCLTQFRVTTGQLKIASGQVRCGACLHVFNAVKNSLSIPTRSADTAKATGSEQQQKAANRSPKIRSEQSVKRTPRSKQPTHKSHTQPDKSQPGTLDHVPSLTDSIETEAVILDAPEITSKPISRIWLAACFLAFGLLCSQLLWFKRVDFYWAYPQLQSGYDLACRYINCDIPPQQNLDLIQNQRIIITPSARYEGVVDLKLILINEANFAQPFPALKLEFSDLKGRRVAQRIFQPRDYLPDSPEATPLLPSQQPAQITLEILSPGPRAVNYQLDLLAPRL